MIAATHRAVCKNRVSRTQPTTRPAPLIKPVVAFKAKTTSSIAERNLALMGPTVDEMGPTVDERFRSLLEAPAPAVLTTYRRDGSALPSPVWFRVHYGALEVVIANGDIKLKHLARRRECTLTVFEAVRPFRGVETRGTPEIMTGDVTPARTAIAARYLGADAAVSFVTHRDPTGTLVRLSLDGARTWDLAGILPTDTTAPSH